MQSLTAPPEISSALVHSGPGPSSLIEASAVWHRLGRTLDEYADDYVASLWSLVETWRGRSAVAMVHTAEPYLAWLRATAQQCRQVAVSSQRAAEAFESVRTAVTPTAAIAANRALRRQLLATNRFGTNTAAIAENENQYLSMWTNNAAAMTRYQAASAQATVLPVFSAPAEDTIPAVFDPNNGWSGLANAYGNGLVSAGFPINLLSYLAQNTSAQALQGVSSAMAQGISEGEAALAPSIPLDALGGFLGGGGGLGALGAAGLSSTPSAAIGVGMKMGTLTVPPAAAGLLPTAPVRLASSATPLPAGQSTTFAGVPAVMPPMAPASHAAGSGWRRRRNQKYEDLEVGLELRGPVMPRPPSAG